MQMLIFQVQDRMASEFMYLKHYYINGKNPKNNRTFLKIKFSTIPYWMSWLAVDVLGRSPLGGSLFSLWQM